MLWNERPELRGGEDNAQTTIDNEIALGLIKISEVRKELVRQGATWYVIPNGLIFLDAESSEQLKPVNIELGGVELVECAAVVWGDKQEVNDVASQVCEGLEKQGFWEDGMTVAAYEIKSLLSWLDGHTQTDYIDPDIDLDEEDVETPEEEVILEDVLGQMKDETYDILFENPGGLSGKVEWIDGEEQFKVTAGLDVLLIANGVNEGKGVINKQGEGTGLVLYGGGFGQVDGVKDLEPIGNVVGLVFFDDDIPLRERKSHLRKVQVSTRRWLNNPEAQVLGVTRSLMSAWLEKGRVVVPEVEVALYLSGADEVDQVDHGFFMPSGRAKKVELLNFEPIPTVGGTQLFLVENMGKIKNTVIVDFGWNFGIQPYLSSMGGRPSWGNGIDAYFRSGLFPKVTRLYRTDALMASVSAQSFNVKDDNTMFVLGELYHRLGKAGFSDMVKQKLPKFYKELNWTYWNGVLDRMKTERYDQKTMYLAAVPSHAHQDHAAGMSLIRPEIPMVLSPWTWMILMADYASGWHWTVQETIRQKDRSKGPVHGNTLPTEERPVTVMHDGESVWLSRSVKLTSWEGYHSVPGAMPQLYQIYNEMDEVMASFAYPGDYRYDPHFFEKVGEIGVHTLFVEGTNVPGGHKLSAAVNEQDVAENIAKVIEGCDSNYGLAVVRLVKGNVERLNNIIDLAGDRQVVITRKVARLLHMAGIYTAAHGGGWWGRTKPPRLDDPRIAIYKGNKSRYFTWEKELMAMPNYHVIDDETLSTYPGDFILVVDHRDHFEAIKVGGPKVHEVRFIDSVYWVYDPMAKMEAKYVMDMCESLGWKYYGDMERGRGGIIRPNRGALYHASGHIGKFDDQVDLIKLTGAQRLIVGHSEHPEKVAKALAAAFPDKEVVQKQNRPWEKWGF